LSIYRKKIKIWYYILKVLCRRNLIDCSKMQQMRISVSLWTSLIYWLCHLDRDYGNDFASTFSIWVSKCYLQLHSHYKTLIHNVRCLSYISLFSNLYKFNLCKPKPNLCKPNLCKFNLRKSNICKPNLCKSNLHNSNLCKLYLCKPNLCKSNLRN